MEVASDTTYCIHCRTKDCWSLNSCLIQQVIRLKEQLAYAQASDKVQTEMVKRLAHKLAIVEINAREAAEHASNSIQVLCKKLKK